MVVVDLTTLKKIDSGLFDWIVTHYGTADKGRWSLKELSYIEFKDSKDALLFMLRWA
jgi:hypothetical protein